MKEMKTLEPKNIKGDHHGYQEWYSYKMGITLRCVAKNGLEVGYNEWHAHKETRFHIR